VRRAGEGLDALGQPATLLPDPAGRKTILVADDHVPFTDRDAGSRRIAFVIEVLAAEGWRVVFASLDKRAYRPYSRALRATGAELITGFDERAVCALKRRGVDVGVAWLCRPAAAQRLAPAFRSEHAATIVFDTVDLHYLRLQREEQILGRPTGWQTMRERELAVARAADVTIVTSSTEAELLRSAGIARVAVIPVVEPPAPGVPAGWEQRSGVLFLGNYAHAPNVDAATWLCNEIMPLVRRRLPALHLTLAGADPPRAVRALAQRNVTVTGYVRDPAEPIARARVLAAPLRFGAGVKGKIVYALAHGIPVVTTPVGAEGVFTAGECDAIASNAEDFAMQIVRLHEDRAAWERAAAAARKAAERFAPAAASQTVRRVLQGSV
jgi:glycosyltransferase involved in cell wall biosynthesis